MYLYGCGLCDDDDDNNSKRQKISKIKQFNGLVKIKTWTSYIFVFVFVFSSNFDFGQTTKHNFIHKDVRACIYECEGVCVFVYWIKKARKIMWILNICKLDLRFTLLSSYFVVVAFVYLFIFLHFRFGVFAHSINECEQFALANIVGFFNLMTNIIEIIVSKK